MTYKKFLEKLETLLIMDVISTKDKRIKKKLRDIVKLIVLFKMSKEKWWKIQENFRIEFLTLKKNDKKILSKDGFWWNF